MASRSFELDLLGQKIVLKANANSAGDASKDVATQDVIDLVNIRIKEATRRLGKTASPSHVAILALVDMAEEYSRAKKRADSYRKAMDKKSEEILGFLENTASQS